MEPHRRCAIKGLLDLRQQKGLVNTKHSRDSVIRWLKRNAPKGCAVTKQNQRGHMINVMNVLPVDFDHLKNEYERNHSFEPAPQQKRLSFSVDATPSSPEEPAPVTEMSSMLQVKKRFTDARTTVLDMADAVSQEAKPITVEDILKSQKLTSLNPSKVGAKATQLFKKKWPGRQLGKRPRLATSGVPIEENAWTEPERDLLEAAAWCVYISEQPSFV